MLTVPLPWARPARRPRPPGKVVRFVLQREALEPLADFLDLVTGRISRKTRALASPWLVSFHRRVGLSVPVPKLRTKRRAREVSCEGRKAGPGTANLAKLTSNSSILLSTFVVASSRDLTEFGDRDGEGDGAARTLSPIIHWLRATPRAPPCSSFSKVGPLRNLLFLNDFPAGRGRKGRERDDKANLRSVFLKRLTTKALRNVV